MKVEKLLIGLREICDDEIFISVTVGVCIVKRALTTKDLDTSVLFAHRKFTIAQDDTREQFYFFTDIPE